MAGMPSIDPLPPTPGRTDDGDLFSDKADTFVAALPVLRAEMNTLTQYLSTDFTNDMTALKNGAAASATASAASAAAAANSASNSAASATASASSASNSATSAASALAAAAAAQAAAGLPSLTGNARKALTVNADGTGVDWTAVDVPSTWANWILLTSNGQTFTVPVGVSRIRSYATGRGGNGANGVAGTRGGGGGGGGGMTFGTIPVVQGEVFVCEIVGNTVKLKKGAVEYLVAYAGGDAAGATGGTPGAIGTIGAGLGIYDAGGYVGGYGGNADVGGNNYPGPGASSGSPIGTGVNGSGKNSGGSGWGGAGAANGGGGGIGQSSTGYVGGGVSWNGASRSFDTAFKDPLLRFCNWSTPTPVTQYDDAAGSGQAGCGGSGKVAGANTHGGNGGLGGGGASRNGNTSGGHGGFGGGGGCYVVAPGGNGGFGGGGGGGGTSGASYAGGTGGWASILIFW